MVSAPLSSIDRDAATKDRLRLWIGMLRAMRLIEGDLREKLKTQFNTTLPRFDVMAALYRQPEGMLMSDLSRFLLVSNGNVTVIVDRLVSDGLVARALRKGDRRTSIVSLTSKGMAVFREMANAHEEWINTLLGGIGVGEARRLAAMFRTFERNWEHEA